MQCSHPHLGFSLDSLVHTQASCRPPFVAVRRDCQHIDHNKRLITTRQWHLDLVVVVRGGHGRGDGDVSSRAHSDNANDVLQRDCMLLMVPGSIRCKANVCLSTNVDAASFDYFIYPRPAGTATIRYV